MAACSRARGVSPSPPRWCALLLAAATTLAPSAAAGRPLRLGAVDLPCPRPQALGDAVVELIGSSVPGDADCALAFTRLAAGYVTARLACGGESFERSVALTEDDCAEIPKALAIVVEGWLRHLQAAQALPPAPERRAVIQPGLSDARQVAADSWRVRLGLLAGANLPVTHAITPAATASADVALTPALAAGLAAGYAGRVAESRDGHRIAVASSFASALVRVALAEHGSQRIELLAGPALDLLVARDGARRHTLAEPSALGVVQLLRPVSRGLAANVALQVRLRARELRFSADQTRVFAMEPLELGLLAGAVFDAD